MAGVLFVCLFLAERLTWKAETSMFCLSRVAAGELRVTVTIASLAGSIKL